jgi:ABC-type transport system involved in multi-copper enzyme maturation permease subunit
VNGILTIARLTWIEARRRRIVLAAVLCGLAFIAIFATAVYFLPDRSGSQANQLFVRFQLQAMTLAGLYAVNFLAVAFSVMLPVDSLSGEIASGVIQTVAAKPVRRVDILLGKWIVYWLMLAAYILLMVGGIVGSMWILKGFLQQNLLPALGLMQLEVSVLISITIAGGVRFSTVTNGIVAFGFYALAFIGGWVEQIGVVLGNAASRYIGTAISLVSPVDALWRLAMHSLVPPVLTPVQVTPFSSASVPSMAMVWWSVAYVVAVMALATRGFQRRAL